MNSLILKKCVALLDAGNVIACPTESVFGLSCDPLNEQAVAHLLEIKHRSEKKGLILVGSDYSQVEPYLGDISKSLKAKMMSSWPGPINWLAPANLDAPDYLRGNSALQAVRITASAFMYALCDAFGGALISTSANVSTRPPARTAIQVRKTFGTQIAYVINGPVDGLKKPCEIRNSLDDRVLRAGS